MKGILQRRSETSSTTGVLAPEGGVSWRELRPRLAIFAGLAILTVVLFPSRSVGPVPDVLIPAFDELLLGWRDRTPTVPPEHAKRVHPGGGILRAVALEDGVAVGTWSRAGGRISVEGF